MLLRAFAKINLDLRVVGRRSDGYHEVRSVLQTIDWFDEVRIAEAGSFQFTSNRSPQDESNLVVRAVRAFERASGIAANLRIDLMKNIPVGSGLGGGSADAAVTFLGLMRHYGWTPGGSLILETLADLGSDVPFFAVGGCAAAFGRGEQVVPLEDLAECSLVVAAPPISVPTVEAYSWLTVPGNASNIFGFYAQFPSSSVAPRAGWTNDFEPPVFARYPELGRIKTQLLELGARRASMSGSGSAIYGEFRDRNDALRAADLLGESVSVCVTKPLPRPEYFRRMMD